ncbi:MOSC domain-containing protein [Sulfitobacter sp. SK011]|uniref:MOSC domain-containing protein n=1 Tax=Sulfitobacter sp. SK011 TaxID=1389004 RepID=UPI000E0AC457|nr:MOSC domain-containing protein [Sulfitobacter sp. SK011]AXI41585.1 sulfurase [Sulfitobacter sp. SK011]
MAELRPTDFIAIVTWLGRVPKKRTNIRSEPIEQAFVSYAGIEDDFHSGLTRASCVRVTAQHPKGTEIRNTRQLSILSVEELDAIARVIGIEAMDPTTLGASIILKGIPDFTYVPPGSRLQTESGTTIVIDVENGPCNFPAREIEKDMPGHGKSFKTAARGKRGVTAWVEREGMIAIGDTLRLHVPDQPQWPHL